jgi:tRNA/tmRNA/rRNA uracil-C5-methylase (TrmA/RlmC/RlmD family)
VKTIRVHIEAVDDEGRGRATHDAYDIAVRGAFIGDDVEMQPERTFAARHLIVGKAVRFFDRGPCHAERVCSHPSPCPACPLHGADGSLSAEIKRGRIERALSDVGIDCEVDDVVMHPQALGYRQKVKLMAQILEGKLRLGVYVPYSHDFVVAELCPYVQPSINEAIPKLLELLNSGCSVTELTQIKAIILRAGRDGVAAVVVTKSRYDARIWEDAVAHKILICVTERVQTATLSKRRSCTTSLLSFSQRIQAPGFFWMPMPESVDSRAPFSGEGPRRSLLLSSLRVHSRPSSNWVCLLC